MRCLNLLLLPAVALAPCALMGEEPPEASADQPTGAAVYDVAPEPERRWLVADWNQHVAFLERRLTEVRREVARARGRAERMAAMEKRDEAERRLEAARVNRPPYVGVPLERAAYRVGAYGIPDNAQGQQSRHRIVQVLDERRVIVDTGRFVGPGWFILDGWATDRLTDGGLAVIDGPIHFTRTHTYTTAIGSTKTVLVAEPLKWERLVEQWAARRDE